jgi:rod shape-determining protein MreC
MFSRKMLMIAGVIVLVFANLIALYITGNRYPTNGVGRIALFFVAPCQKLVNDTLRFTRGIWQNYFALVSVAQENSKLKASLRQAISINQQHHEVELSNVRLRNLLNFQTTTSEESIAAEVIGRDPSSWFDAIIIDKGGSDGLQKGLPVVVPEGIAGQVTDVSDHYAKVMLIIDRNSAVDALVQRTRARGILKGGTSSRCIFKYVVRTEDVKVGDKIVSSGFDQVFPKGQPIGDVVSVVKQSSEMFQEVRVLPYVDFEKLEEVLVLLNAAKRESNTPP